MPLKEYVGSIGISVDGQDYDVVSFAVKHNTGRKIVKTMNRKGKALGFTRGVQTWEIDLTAAIPKEGEVAWVGVEGAVITVEPVGGGGREIYRDCVVTEQGKKYDSEKEALVDVKIVALDFEQE